MNVIRFTSMSMEDPDENDSQPCAELTHSIDKAKNVITYDTTREIILFDRDESHINMGRARKIKKNVIKIFYNVTFERVKR